MLFLRLLRYYLVTLQATQLLSYACVPSSYAIISKGTFSSRLKLRLRSICSYVYVARYQATLTFQALLTFLLKLCCNYKRYAFNPESSYAYLPYAASLRSKIPSYAYVPRYAYAPKHKATKLHSFSAMLTLQDTLTFRQVTL